MKLDTLCTLPRVLLNFQKPKLNPLITFLTLNVRPTESQFPIANFTVIWYHLRVEDEHLWLGKATIKWVESFSLFQQTSLTFRFTLSLPCHSSHPFSIRKFILPKSYCNQQPILYSIWLGFITKFAILNLFSVQFYLWLNIIAKNFHKTSISNFISAVYFTTHVHLK